METIGIGWSLLLVSPFVVIIGVLMYRLRQIDKDEDKRAAERRRQYEAGRNVEH